MSLLQGQIAPPPPEPTPEPRSITVTEARWSVSAEPTLEEAVAPLGRFEKAEPAPKLAIRVIEGATPAGESVGPVLPSRGAPVRQQKAQPADSVWLPVPSLVGPMPMADGAPFDPAVLPVRRPQLSAADGNPQEAAPSGWPEPQSLFEMLDGLAWDCETGLWAREVARQVRKLGRAVSQRSAETGAILSDLYDLGVEADKLAAGLSDRGKASQVLRAEHAFGRRLDIWRRLIVPGEALSKSWQLTTGDSAGRIDAAELLERLERYESTGLGSDAERVAEVCRRLERLTTERERGLDRRLETHYRNANVRLAVTDVLLNELIPEREPEQQRVRDTVLGRPVYGRSTTSSEVAVRLIPDPERLRMAMEVDGLISAETTSTAGPATYYSNSKSTYRAWKEMEVGTWGIRVWPAKVDVDNDVWLRAWETRLDAVPLVGPLVHGMAKNQHDRQLPLAEQEVESKVASRVKKQFDEQSQARLEALSEMLEQRIFQPLERISLQPASVSAETTESRMATRLRLATDDQLGSSTPRPEAPSDSLLSLQVHQSAVNNVIEQLELDGHTFTLAELRRHVADKLNRPEVAEMGDDQDEAEITFAERDAVHVQLGDGQVTLVMSIAELSTSSHHWADFQVRVFYRPAVDGRTARLVRDGVIQLIGELNMRSQIALRGVFSKTFHKDRAWVITPEALASNPRYEETTITQLVIDDGWVGFALGPAGSEPRVARFSSP